MKTLKGRVAVVAGASRGAGRGIALALGDAGATVYVAGRTVRGGAKPSDGAAGTIDDTADEVSARGGVGIPVRTDFTNEVEVAALFDRVRTEQGKLDVLANAVWGAADGYRDSELMSAWGKKFWELPPASWQNMIGAGPGAYFLASHHAMQLMASQKRGLIVGITDFIMDGVSDDVLRGAIEAGGYGSGQLLWTLAHEMINRLMYAMSAEANSCKVAVVTLMPGFMRTERVQQYLNTEKLRKMMRYDLAESTEYLGRAVAALAGDAKVLKKTGRIHFVADLAREYGFTDVDGRQVPRFNPHAAA
jgi:NAD(P)-dependent dehydrogenase (short-subunit alcohol dehydrogenase family)